ncbi:MAG UNVERIFIED_CONTAM: hypothetical protein LVR18_48770 [Planctomycetaceae bacterium]
MHDILTLLSSTVFHERQPRKVHLVGVNGAAAHAIAAAAVAGKQLASLAVDTQKFRFATITEIRDPNLLPGAVKYGDLPALLALCRTASHRSRRGNRKLAPHRTRRISVRLRPTATAS